MPDTTNIGSFTIPSSDPLFLGIVAIHVLLGIAAIVAGLVAMLSVKAPGRHPRAGTWYFWLLASLFATTTALSMMRWAHAYHLFIIGAFALAAAIIGREASKLGYGPDSPYTHQPEFASIASVTRDNLLVALDARTGGVSRTMTRSG